MSYYASIAFKVLEPADVYPFLQTFKKESIEKIKEIAEENHAFSPLFRSIYTKTLEITDEQRKETEAWALNYVFKHRYFYLPECSLLGMYSVPTCLGYLFDAVIGFQNSCDQDYDYETWANIPCFAEIANKWKNMPIAEAAKALKLDGTNPSFADIDYGSKTACYDEIWNKIEWSLENDSEVLYVSLFGSYEYLAIERFIEATKDSIRQTIEKWNNKKT